MKKTVKTIVKLLGSALCALLFAVNAVPGMDMVLELPDDIYVDEAGGAERLCGIPAPFSITDRDGVAVPTRRPAFGGSILFVAGG